MSMDVEEAFSSIKENKEEKYAFWELKWEFLITYWHYKEITKFADFNNFHCLKWIILGGKPYLLNWKWSVRSGGSIDLKQWELGQASVGYAILKPHVSFLASHFYYSFQSISNVFIRPIQNTQCYLEQSYTSTALESYG